jgi:hypothetical protein
MKPPQELSHCHDMSENRCQNMHKIALVLEQAFLAAYPIAMLHLFSVNALLPAIDQSRN